MLPFEYLGVFVSIILGLGVTQLLASLAGALRERGEFRLDDVSMAWAGTLLLVHVQTWWALFELRDRADWNFLQFMLVLLPPVLLYLLAALALPPPGSRLGLAANFARHRRWFFGLLLALLAASLGKDLGLRGSLPDPANLAFHVGIAVLAVLAGSSSSTRFQRAFAWSALACVGTYIATLFGRLQ